MCAPLHTGYLLANLYLSVTSELSSEPRNTTAKRKEVGIKLINIMQSIYLNYSIEIKRIP